MEQIRARGISKGYRIGGERLVALDHLDLSVAKGEFLAITGHSGSGKSTLLSLIGGINRPDAGEIDIDGIRLGNLDDDALSDFRNRRLNFIFQFASLLPTLTVLENVMLPALLRQDGERNRRVLAPQALRLLEEVGIGDKAAARPSQLSGGQQRRVAIARAFMNEPEIVLADEPTGDLDAATEAEIMAFFRRRNRNQATTFIIVTHSLEIAAAADRQLAMAAGRLA